MKRALFALTLICSVASSGQATVIYGTSEASFAGATVETFRAAGVNSPSTYNFGNGMVYNNISGGAFINYTGGYGMGSNPSISSGRSGSGDGYLGTTLSPSSFSLNFAGGISKFGFSGAEAAVSDSSAGRNGILDIDFYNVSNVLIGSFAINTNGPFAWNQWHGFSSDTMIGKVVFDMIGHSVFDDVKFDSTPVSSSVPDSGMSIALLGTGLLALFGVRRKLAA
jgi:hypothetical protein